MTWVSVSAGEDCRQRLQQLRQTLSDQQSDVATIASGVDAANETWKMDETFTSLDGLIKDLADFIERVEEAMVLAGDRGYAGDLARQGLLDECSRLLNKHFDLGSGAQGKTADQISDLVAERNAAEKRVDDLLNPRATEPPEMEPEELDQALRSMSDEQLERFIQIHGGTAYFDEVLTTVDLDTVYRIADQTELIDPNPRKGILDDQRGRKPTSDTWFDELIYVDRRDWTLYGPGNYELDPADIQQGRIGDCYLVSAVISLGYEDPQILSDLVQQNPNGTYTVTFADGTTEVVTPRVVYHPSDLNKPAYGRSDSMNAIYVPLIEKAVAQRGRDNKREGWQSLPWGSQHSAIELLTGRPGERRENADFNDVVEFARQGANLGLATVQLPTGVDRGEWRKDPATPKLFRENSKPRLDPGHAYVVVGVDEANGTIDLINPLHAGEIITVSESDFDESFRAVVVNTP